MRTVDRINEKPTAARDPGRRDDVTVFHPQPIGETLELARLATAMRRWRAGALQAERDFNAGRVRVFHGYTRHRDEWWWAGWQQGGQTLAHALGCPGFHAALRGQRWHVDSPAAMFTPLGFPRLGVTVDATSPLASWAEPEPPKNATPKGKAQRKVA